MWKPKQSKTFLLRRASSLCCGTYFKLNWFYTCCFIKYVVHLCPPTLAKISHYIRGGFRLYYSFRCRRFEQKNKIGKTHSSKTFVAVSHFNSCKIHPQNNPFKQYTLTTKAVIQYHVINQWLHLFNFSSNFFHNYAQNKRNLVQEQRQGILENVCYTILTLTIYWYTPIVLLLEQRTASKTLFYKPSLK